jgi:YidC/Oxa1 family membrane protein insertase
MASILYTIIIYPLIQILELVYVAFQNTFYVPGVSVIGISVAVTALCLPLYVVSEKWQQIERDAEKKMAPGVKRIKETFRSDEQYMMLSAFYKEHHYHPIMALRSSFGLLIQIPFFMAAYIFLSKLPQLQGQSFLFIRNMGKPDALFTIGTFSVNVLPIAMTIINIIAGAIYCRGFPLKDKIQLYAMAVIFLVLLYTSPSGLVLYWTMNNIFSLVKNVFYKFKNPLRVLYFCVCALFLALDVYFIVTGTSLSKAGFLVALSLIVPFAPFIVNGCRTTIRVIFAGIRIDDTQRNLLFIVSALTICLLTGFTTPSNVIVSSPQEFSFVDSYTTPLFFISNTLLQALGSFFFWPICIYFLFSRKVQSGIAFVFSVLALDSLVNVFLFPGHYGFLSPLLIYESDGGFHTSAGELFLNCIAILVPAALILIVLYWRRQYWITRLTFVFALGLGGLGIYNCIKINNSYKQLATVYTNEQTTSIQPVFHLSKTGKNVFVIMLDRAINGYIPEIFNEAPQLKSVYSGFKYYPNTVSFGFFTLQGAPALFGGYEYTPLEINKRKNEPLVDKHNEALSVLPRIFAKNGWLATMADAPWANYSWISDMSFMSQYPEKINTIHTMKKYKTEWYHEHNTEIPAVQSTLNKRNFIWFGIMKNMPMFMRSAIYNDGDWWASASVASRNNTFLDSYSVLDFMPRLTDVTSDQNTFTFIDNDTTHDPVICQAPDYVPVATVTNKGTSQFADNEHYHANAAAIHRISEWITYLKEQGVYDNTRIIIASDHGRNVKTGQFMHEKKLPFMREFANPLLLVKDFNASGDLTTDMTFMTNADVPTLAVKDVIADPINPFTGKDITTQVKKDIVTITSSKNWIPQQQNKTTLAIAPDDWYTVHDSIFDEKNWAKVKIIQKHLENDSGDSK